VREALLKLLACPDLASRRWIWEQYDYLVRGQTAIRPGGDAALVRVDDTEKALAVTTDCSPRYCVADPVMGGRQAVVEAYRNISATGATPLAVTNNLNFGNPEREAIMGQFVGCVTGMGEACRALDFPVVSGNVSFYNETNGKGILPTPVIGGVGLIEDWSKAVTIAPAAGHTLVLIGEPGGWLGASLYLREIVGSEDGAPPPVNLEDERRAGELVRSLIAEGIVAACHDLSDGGLLVAAAEMALAGHVGLALAATGPDMSPHGYWFGEDQGRYLVATAAPDRVIEAAGAARLARTVVGTVGGDALTLDGFDPISLAELGRAHESWLPTYMAQP